MQLVWQIPSAPWLFVPSESSDCTFLLAEASTVIQGMMVLAYRIQADVLRSAEEDKSKEIKAD